jgi:excisionase family DNA binding protein
MVTGTRAAWSVTNGPGESENVGTSFRNSSEDAPRGIDEPLLVDMETVARWLSTSTRHVRRLVAERRIPFVKVGHFVRFDPADVARWVEAQKVEVGQGTPEGGTPWVRHPVARVAEEQKLAPRTSSRQAPSHKNIDPPWLSGRRG